MAKQPRSLRPASTSSVSQSVGRFVRLLEVFEASRRPMSSAEIGAQLAAPRSSVAALLKALVDMSILSLDRRTATYLPTARLGRLASWVTDPAFIEADVLDLVRRVQIKVEETVTLSAPVEVWAELILLERGSQGISFVADVGQRISFWGTAVGTAYLSTLAKEAVGSLYERSLRRGGDFRPTDSLERIQRRIAEAQRQGYAMVVGGFTSDATAVAMALPAAAGPRQTIVAVAGPTRRIKAKEATIIGSLRSEIRRLEKLAGFGEPA